MLPTRDYNVVQWGLRCVIHFFGKQLQIVSIKIFNPNMVVFFK